MTSTFNPVAVTDRCGSHFATLLSARLRPVLRDGKKLYEIPIAVTGSWVKHGRRFQITLEDLTTMALNFSKRKNEQIVIDYEHASETPEVAQGGPIPAAGWIHHLESGKRESAAGSRGDASLDSRLPGPDSLRALVEWTPEAERLIQQGAYRFFSPAIDWGYHDKQTGEPQGATLTSGALTNHPFLEELPPIMLTDLDGTSLRVVSGQSSVAETSSATHNGARTTDVFSLQLDEEGESNMKKLTVRKLKDGTLAGHHGVFDGDDAVGYVHADEFREYAKQRLDEGEFAGLLAESELSESTGHALRLLETVKDGVVNQARAKELARDNRITLADYMAVQDAEKKLDEAVREGKILPRDRQFFFRDALERPSEFADFVKRAIPVVRLGSQGIGSAGDISVDEEVEIRTRNLMKDEGLSYAKALRRVLAGDKELERRYHGVHRREIGSTSGSAVSGAEAAGITQ